MSETFDKNAVAIFLAILALVVTVAGLAVATGVITPNNDAEGFLANIQYGAEQWAENPIAVATIATLVIGVFGYLENVALKHEPYQVRKLLETAMVYEPLILLFSQALPMKYALVLAVVLDILRRVVKAKPPST